MRRACGLLLALCIVLTACSGAGERGADRLRATSTSTASTSTSTTALPATTVPVVTEVPRPDSVGNDGYRWYVHAVDGGMQLLLAVRRSTLTGRHPAVLLADTSGGFNLDYLTFADELVARGLDVAVGCLYSAPDVLGPESGRIPCATAPLFDGVVDSMVAGLDSLVDATYGALGASTRLAVMGFSRGAGIAALRASAGAKTANRGIPDSPERPMVRRSEPVVLASGRYVGWSSGGAAGPTGDVNVVDRVGSWKAPALILHGTIDAAVPFQQSLDLEAALRATGADVESHYYEGAGHNLSGEPAVHDDLLDRVTAFLCSRLGCSGA